MTALHNSSSRAAFLAAGTAFAACPHVVGAQALQELAIGSSPIDGGMGTIAAVRGGFFRRYGLDASLSFANGAANAAAVTGGSLQFAASNIVTLIKAHLNGLPFQLVAPGAIYTSDNPTQVLVVPKNSSLHNAADLNGKTIATTSLGDILAQSTLAWIEQHGGSAASVHLVELPPSAVEGALQAKRVDAATLAEPHLSQAVGDGSVVIFAKIFDAIAPRFVESACFAMPAYVDANRDLTVRVAKAILAGNAFANQHPDRTEQWLVETAKVDDASVKRSRRERFAASFDAKDIQVVIDALVRMKAIDRGFNATEMISPAVIGLRP